MATEIFLICILNRQAFSKLKCGTTKNPSKSTALAVALEFSFDDTKDGSVMRVSSAGWLYDTLEQIREVARLMVEVTHNHLEGIKGAEATAFAIPLVRTGKSKEEIKEYIINEFGYDLSRTFDDIRLGYHHIESCQQTVPEAVTGFLEENDFEDVVRCTFSLCVDCDTLTCIAEE